MSNVKTTKDFLEKKLLHYTGKAIADFNMIQTGDRVLVAVSGGKDSMVLLKLLRLLQMRTNNKFTIFAFTLNQSQPGWSDENLRLWLEQSGIPFSIVKQDIYNIVKQKTLIGQNFCSFCSRLRRGAIYSFAKQEGFTKIALGHHRDDLIESLLMSVLYSGEIRSQPPKLITDDRKHILIRPMAYCQEKDIGLYAKKQNFITTPCGDCGITKQSMRESVKHLINELAQSNPKVPSNILHALQAVRLSQLMDQKLWNFKDLEKMLIL